MKVKELYNALEKAVDSGRTNLENDILIELNGITLYAQKVEIYFEGDIIIKN